jgi:Ca-activated chloride channel family protein
MPRLKKRLGTYVNEEINMINIHTKKSFVLLILGLLTFLMLTACSSSAEKLNQDGNEAFIKEQFEEALAAYQSAKVENPELAEPYYNAANTLYRQGNYAAAMEQLQGALSYVDDDSLAEKSFYNLGNNYFNTQELETAVEAYKQALLLNPEDLEAKYNLELALQQQQQQQEQQQDQEQEQQEQEQSQEGENQEQEQSEGGDQSDGDESQEQEQQNQEQSGENQQGDNQQDGENQQPENQHEGDPKQNDPGQQPNKGQDDESNEQSQPGQVPSPGERMTEEQARQLLAAIAEDSDTLWERLEQIFFVRDLPPVQDW